MLRQHALALLILVSMMVASVHAGPFGFKMGMSLEEAKALEGVVVTRKFSSDHRETIEITKPIEVAYSDRMDVGNGGEKIMKEYQVLRDQLHEMYKMGGVRKEGFFTSNSWESPEEWTQRFIYLSSAFITTWKDMSALGGKPFKDDVQQVTLSVLASFGKGRFQLQIDFKNSFSAY